MLGISKSVLLISLIFSCKTTHNSNGLSDLSSIDESQELEIYSFKPLNVPNPMDTRDLKTIKKQKYPRIFQTTYRASSKHQFPLTHMIRAMFSDPYVPIESKQFAAWKFYMKGMEIPFPIREETLAWIKKMSSSYEIPSEYSDEELIKILQKNVFHDMRKESSEDLRDKYVYYKSPKYSDFSDDLIYTTTLPFVASFYGPRFVEINEWQSPVNNGSPRSVDMNFLNYEKYGIWLEDGLPARMSFYWEDSSQFLTPMLTHSTAITGYQIRDSYKAIDRTVKNSWNIFEIINKKLIGEFKSVYQVYSPIDYAFYKIRYKGEDIIGVFDGAKTDGSKSSCMIRSLSHLNGGYKSSFDHQIPYHCEESKPWLYPKKTNEQASLIAFVKSCKIMESCSLDDSLKNLFKNRSTKKLPEEMIKKIESLSVFDFGLVKQSRNLNYISIEEEK